MKKISILVPCYNEEQNIELMYQKLTQQMSNIQEIDYEIIFADNHSKDNSRNVLKDIAAIDKRVKVIINQSNFGIERSAINMFKRMNSDACIYIPCDFQEPIELIPQFIQRWKEGTKIIFGQKIKSDENFFKFLCRDIYYYIIDKMSDYPQIPHITGFGLIDKSVIDTMLEMLLQDPIVSIRHLVVELGYEVYLIPYKQRKRERGKSSYNIAKYFSFAISSMCNTSTRPLRYITVLGLISSLCSFGIGIIYLIYKCLRWDSFDLGIAPLIIGLFFLFSIILFSIGIIGEYIGIILRRVTERPLVIEEEIINFDTVL